MSDFEQYLIDSFGETWERSGIMDAHNAALAAEREKVSELEQWKESAMSVMPDYQAIGKALDLPVGTSVNEQLLPAIQQLRDQLEALRL